MNVCVFVPMYTGMLLGDRVRVCVCVRERRVLVWRESMCVFVGQGGCIEGVEADSRIPFSLVSVGLDQV